MTETQGIPHFIYGTAWKESATADLTYLALKTGYRAIDTANQRKHYFEAGVGEGLKKFWAESGLSRDDIFLQTKFTYSRGQDHRKPYNEQDPFRKQVQDSFASSLEHLGTDHLDSYVLHGPYYNDGLGEEDFETWTAMEAHHKKGQTKFLGVSNINASQLRELLTKVSVKPTFVQNRCFARFKWDADVRQICRQHGIYYQGFSLLTANVNELSTAPVVDLVHKYRKTIPQIVFKFAQKVGMIPLTGTTDPEHMKEDLQIEDFDLSAAELELIENLGK
ncbi:MAG: aldo/keto reductase family protein [Bdellovibrionales bacterium]